jgi:hypothetical protein
MALSSLSAVTAMAMAQPHLPTVATVALSAPTMAVELPAAPVELPAALAAVQ